MTAVHGVKDHRPREADIFKAGEGETSTKTEVVGTRVLDRVAHTGGDLRGGTELLRAFGYEPAGIAEETGFGVEKKGPACGDWAMVERTTLRGKRHHRKKGSHYSRDDENGPSEGGPVEHTSSLKNVPTYKALKDTLVTEVVSRELPLRLVHVAN